MRQRRLGKLMLRALAVAALLALPGTAAPAGSYRDTVLADSPTGYWRLGESAGTTAANEVPAAAAGTYQGGFTLGVTGALAGDPNTAVTLNGTTGQVSIPSASSWNLGDGPFTIEAWVKRAATNRIDVIVHKGSNAYQLRYSSGNKLQLIQPAVGTVASSTLSVTDTEWHYVAATRNGADVHLYVDGVDATGTDTSRTLQNNSAALEIGTDNSALLSGSVDEVAIYKSALGADRIRAHYDAGRNPPPTTFVTLAFDDGYADQYTIRSDLSGHGMHATFYINSGTLDVSTHALTWQQVHDLAADGNEIAGHTVLHPDLLTLSATEQRREICNDRVNLLNEAFAVTSFALPFGSGDDVTRGIAQECGYNTLRGASPPITPTGPFAETIPPQNPFALRTPPGVADSTTLAEIQSWVTRAEQHGGGWIELRFHHVCNNACDPRSITRANFAALLNWLAPRTANGTVVRTNHEVWGGNVQPAVAGPAPPAAPAVGNDSLEDDANLDQLPDCWEQDGYGNNAPTWTRTPDAHSGTFAEQLDLSLYVDGQAHLLTRRDLGDCTPTVIPGKTYELSAWYKASAPVQFFLYYRTAGGGFPYWISSPFFPAASAWTPVTWRTAPVPPGATGLAFGLSLGTNGSLTTDDYAIRETTPTGVGVASFGASKPTKSRTVTVRWRTAAPGELGFNLYREAGIRLTRLNRAIIPASSAVAGASYRWVDRLPRTFEGSPCYRLERVRLDGATAFVRTCVSSLAFR